MLAVADAAVEYDEESKGHMSFPPIPSDATDILLKSNSISSISTSQLSGFYQLVKLDLQQNLLTQFPDLSPIKTTLEDLNLKKNDIFVIDGHLISQLVKLKKLDLQWNDIASFPDVSGPPLEILYLRFNPIQLWPTFGGIKATLEQLTLDIRNEEELHADRFQGFSSLDYLNINSNSLQTVPNFTYILDTLTSLQIDNLHLTSAPIGHMAILGKLSSLTLSSVSLWQIPPTCSGPGSWINVMMSAFDPCDCKMVWMKQVVEAGGYVAVHHFKKCWGTSWSSLTSQQLLQGCQPGFPHSKYDFSVVKDFCLLCIS